MNDSLTEVLERAAGNVPPAPDVSKLVEAGRRRRRHSTLAATAATVAGLAVLVGVVATTWPTMDSLPQSEILDQPPATLEAWAGQPIDAAIFLCDDLRCPAITDEQLRDLHAQLDADPAVEAVYYESKEDAFERFSEEFADQAPELVEETSPDQLPASFRLDLTDPQRFDALQESYGDHPGVEEIVNRNQDAIKTTDLPADGEVEPAEIYMVEVTADGTGLDLHVEACGQQATLVEFQETPTEIRARIVRRPEPDPTGCHTSFRRTLDAPLNGRPVIDLMTGASVDVNELPSP